ncbi:MAG: hypothetical protein R2712_27955 [Vicinamibacterales bacterium]
MPASWHHLGMTMMSWTELLLIYALYLLALAWGTNRFARARAAALGLAALAAVLWLIWPKASMVGTGAAGVIQAVVLSPPCWRRNGRPAPTSRRLTVAWSAGWRRRPGLARCDRRIYDLPCIAARRPRAPSRPCICWSTCCRRVGAAVLVAGGEPSRLEHWRVVFAAVLSCYGLLPSGCSAGLRASWPLPRPDAARPGPLRRLNERILSAGSIQANTIPSGHAAGAVAIGLAVWSVFLPPALFPRHRTRHQRRDRAGPLSLPRRIRPRRRGRDRRMDS